MSFVRRQQATLLSWCNQIYDLDASHNRKLHDSRPRLRSLLWRGVLWCFITYCQVWSFFTAQVSWDCFLLSFSQTFQGKIAVKSKESILGLYVKLLSWSSVSVLVLDRVQANENSPLYFEAQVRLTEGDSVTPAFGFRHLYIIHC